jgi:hypothetical protein
LTNVKSENCILDRNGRCSTFKLIFIKDEVGLDEPELTLLEIFASTTEKSSVASCVVELRTIFGGVFIISSLEAHAVHGWEDVTAPLS